jgi:cytochrome oxidase Cu insertion factor (SCO1/SenC/PrrC family)
MRLLSRLVLALCMAAVPASAFAQPEKKKNEEDFVKEKPTIGDTLPDLTVYSPDGKEVKLSSLRGNHVVVVFGCLT